MNPLGMNDPSIIGTVRSQDTKQPDRILILPASMFEIPFAGSPGTPRPNLPPRQTGPNPSLIQHPPVGSTGPELLVIIAAGASAGVAWVRRRKL